MSADFFDIDLRFTGILVMADFACQLTWSASPSRLCVWPRTTVALGHGHTLVFVGTCFFRLLFFVCFVLVLLGLVCFEHTRNPERDQQLAYPHVERGSRVG